MSELTAEETRRLLEEIARNTSGMVNIARQDRGGREDRQQRALVRVFADGVAGMAGNMKAMATGFSSASRSLHAFSSQLDRTSGIFNKLSSAIGGAVGGIVGVFTSAGEAYRSMASHGQLFQGSIIEMRQAAAASGQSLREFTEMINQQTSNVAAVLGGRNFGILNRNVREAAEQFGMFGYSSQQLNEFTSEYLETQRLNQNLMRYSMDQHRESVISLMQTTTGYAALFGKHRRDTMRDLAQSSRDVALLGRNLSNSRLNRGQQQALDSRLGFLSALPGGASQFGNWLSRSVGARGTFMSELHDQFSLVPGLAAEVDRMRAMVERGQSASFDDNYEAMQRVYRLIQQAAPQLTARAARGDANARNIIETGAGMGQFLARDREQSRREWEAAQRQEAITNLVNTFSNMIGRVQGAFVEGLLEPIRSLERAFTAANFDGTVRTFMNSLQGLGTRFGILMRDTFTPERVQRWATAIMTLLTAGLGGLETFVRRIVDWLDQPENMTRLQESITAFFDFTGNGLTTFVTQAMNFTTALGNVLTRLTPILNWAADNPMLALAGGLVAGGLLLGAVRMVLSLIAGGTVRMIGGMLPGMLAGAAGAGGLGGLAAAAAPAAAAAAPGVAAAAAPAAAAAAPAAAAAASRAAMASRVLGGVGAALLLYQGLEAIRRDRTEARVEFNRRHMGSSARANAVAEGFYGGLTAEEAERMRERRNNVPRAAEPQELSRLRDRMREIEESVRTRGRDMSEEELTRLDTETRENRQRMEAMITELRRQNETLERQHRERMDLEERTLREMRRWPEAFP